MNDKSPLDAGPITREQLKYIKNKMKNLIRKSAALKLAKATWSRVPAAERVDVSAIYQKIKGEKYNSLNEIYLDFKRIVDNTSMYYGDAHPYHGYAYSLREYFRNQMGDYPSGRAVVTQPAAPVSVPSDTNQPPAVLPPSYYTATNTSRGHQLQQQGAHMPFFSPVNQLQQHQDDLMQFPYANQPQHPGGPFFTYQPQLQGAFTPNFAPFLQPQNQGGFMPAQPQNQGGFMPAQPQHQGSPATASSVATQPTSNTFISPTARDATYEEEDDELEYE